MTLQYSGNLDAGDSDFRYGTTLTFDSGGNNISGGDAVTFDGSGNITRTTANADDLIGIAANPSDEKGDDKYSVHIAGKVILIQLASDGTCGEGDLLIPSGTDNGKFNGSAGGLVQAVDEGGSATYNVYTSHPIALESGGNNDVVLAAMR